MNKLEELYNIVKNENIQIRKFELDNSNGLYLKINNTDLILINNNINDYRLEKCTLAEELGHYYTGVSPTPPFATDYYTKLQRSKNESKALKWCANKLIPLNTLKSLIQKNMSKFDIVEEVNITEEFIDKVYSLYEDKMKGDCNGRTY